MVCGRNSSKTIFDRNLVRVCGAWAWISCRIAISTAHPPHNGYKRVSICDMQYDGFCAPLRCQFSAAIVSTECHKIWPSALSLRRISRLGVSFFCCYCRRLYVCLCHVFLVFVLLLLLPSFAIAIFIIMAVGPYSACLLCKALTSFHSTFGSFFPIIFSAVRCHFFFKFLCLFTLFIFRMHCTLVACEHGWTQPK